MLNSKVMKHRTCGIVFLLVALAAPVSYASEPDRGVAGVDVVVKQIPNKRDVTNAWGIFALNPLPAGSYTLTFRARKGGDLPGSISRKVIVAMTYSIKIEGTKRAVNKTRLTSDDLLAGVDLVVDCGPGAKIRGQVASGSLKNMVWIPKELGSNIQGHWAAEDSPEAKAAPHHQAEQMTVEGQRQKTR